MYDPYQCAAIIKQQKKERKKNYAFLNFLVSMIVAVAGLYIVDVFFNILEKKSLKSIFNVRSTWQAYFASIIAGGINGILVVYLPSKIYGTAAVIILTVIYETIAKMTGLESLNNYELTQSIVRDIFLINIIFYVFNQFSDNNINNDDNEEVILGELIDVTLISSIIINLTIVSTRYGLNSILGIESNN